jgi:amino acid adenylation domain-containing protein
VYVPVDPELPAERRAFMIRDCSAEMALTADLGEDLLPSSALQQVDCSTLGDVLARERTDNLELSIDRAIPAYVMYTSGSTGVPKGVVVPHHAINRLVINNGYAQFSPDDCLAHHSNAAFDASTLEIWGALLNGARVVIVPQEEVLEAERFAATLQREGVTTLYMSVGLFNQYARALAGVFARLRYLLVGGDVLDAEIIRRVLRDEPPRNLLNVYGPTETTTFATTYRIESVPLGAKSIPIGRPMANARVYILDRWCEPAPIGVVGEIHIGGDGVACGYLNRAELTAERFLPDPFSGDPRRRRDRSGDLGRWRADGAIEFLGRNDHQVKIRGFRIELGEIETHLLRYPQVKEAAIVAIAEGGDKRLVAYVAAHEQGALSVDALRAGLKEVLPDYMVPSAFVMLDRLPLTSTGKLDRRALPAPDLSAYTSNEYEAPAGEIEETVALTWRELLHALRVGRRDNFFELGGHSLLAMQVMARLRSALALDVPIAALFEFPTLQQFSSHLEELRYRALAERITAGDGELEELLQAISSMPESTAQQMLQDLRMEKTL